MGAGKVEMTDTSKSTQPMPSHPPNEAGQLYFSLRNNLIMWENHVHALSTIDASPDGDLFYGSAQA
ncbi:hypothetical protein KY285_001707 [Solanum tuberosum]|nr:hypothetical protein KY285_001707 [Solanum tuberosum]